VLLQSRQNEELKWKTFMNSLDFFKAMPFYLHVEILKHIFKQVYKANTVVYDVDE